MNRDFVEMWSALCAAGAEFLVRPTAENSDRVLAALRSFGAPLFHVTRDDLTRPDTVLQIGVPPSRIDLLSDVSGLIFDDAWKNRIEIVVGDLTDPVIGRDDFVRNKRVSGPPTGPERPDSPPTGRARATEGHPRTSGGSFGPRRTDQIDVRQP